MEVLIKRNEIIKLINQTVKQAFLKSVQAISDSLHEFILKQVETLRRKLAEDCRALAFGELERLFKISDRKFEKLDADLLSLKQKVESVAKRDLTQARESVVQPTSVVPVKKYLVEFNSANRQTFISSSKSINRFGEGRSSRKKLFSNVYA